MKKAILEQYFPDVGLWKPTEEVLVLEETPKFVKVRRPNWRLGFLTKPKWYYKRSVGMRFNVIDT